MTQFEFDKTPLHLVNGDTVFLTDTIKAILVNGYTFSAAHDTLADVKASAGYAEASGATSNYPAGGVTLASKTVAAATNVTTLDCADLSVVTNAGGSITATGTVFYKVGATDALSYLISYHDFGGAKTASDTGMLSLTTGSGIVSYTAQTA